MSIVDADAHVIETERTWEFMDTSSEIEALSRLQENGKVSAACAHKILDTNARALYGL